MADSGTLLTGAAPAASAGVPAVAPVAPAAGASPETGAVTPAASAAPNSPAWTWADDAGKFSDGWLEKAGFKDDPTLSTIRDLPGLARAYKETKSLVGRKLTPPDEKSTPEQVAEWRKLMGAPEKPEDYGTLKPDKFPDEMWSPDIEKAAIDLAHKHHLPPAVLKEFAALQAEGTRVAYEREVQAAKDRLAAGQAELSKEWGEQFERRATEARALAAALGIPETDDIFLTRPDLVKKLAAAAPTLLGADRVVTGTPQGVSGGLQERVDQIRASADYQGTNGFDRQKAAQAQLHQLLAAQAKTKPTLAA
jgi:hypothetical protein